MPPKRNRNLCRVRPHVLEEEVFTTNQVAHDLNISVRTVLRVIHAGNLTARKTGKKYLITRRPSATGGKTCPSHQGTPTSRLGRLTHTRSTDQAGAYFFFKKKKK